MIRNVVVLCLFLGALAWCDSPTNGETQKVVLDNQFVRVLDIRVPPGVFEPLHSHARGVTIALSDYDNETTSYPDKKINRSHTRFGEVRWAEPVTHEARNTGTSEQHVIRIELKKDTPGPAPAQNDPLDSLVACKDTQKLIFENRYVRVIEERVPPGVGQPKHRHAQGVLIPLANSSIEAVDDPDGRVARRELKFGDAGWRDPVVHAVRNVGQTELLNIRVELR
ncbi:MAG TPA: hypothetical protein VLY24_13900 [Bryobacteraceae bacterium]|nr:hypothetical protein [Bryobacteraceae bacterium]